MTHAQADKSEAFEKWLKDNDKTPRLWNIDDLKNLFNYVTDFSLCSKARPEEKHKEKAALTMDCPNCKKEFLLVGPTDEEIIEEADNYPLGSARTSFIDGTTFIRDNLKLQAVSVDVLPSEVDSKKECARLTREHAWGVDGVHAWGKCLDWLRSYVTERIKGSNE